MNATDIEALHALYVENRQELYTYALSITGNREAAEDAIHGVFERLLRGRGLRPNLRAYVFRSVRNAAYDAWRRTKVRADSIFDEATVVDAAEAGSLEPGGADDFGPLLQRLSADEREAIVLKIHGGLTFQQISELRGAPLPTVASWYRRGLERLKTMLTEER
jgi:RNA polymerase sigma-70 factor (ECF subfamily)